MLKNLTANTATATKRARFILITLLIALMAVAVNAQGNRSAQSDAATVFRSARDLITDGEWARAQAKFDEYVSAYPNEKNIDAALYWLAYTQQRLAKYDQCRSSLERLLEKYPNSTWRDDARVLLAQIPTYTTNYAAAVAASDELVAKLKLESTPLPKFEGS